MSALDAVSACNLALGIAIYIGWHVRAFILARRARKQALAMRASRFTASVRYGHEQRVRDAWGAE